MKNSSSNQLCYDIVTKEIFKRLDYELKITKVEGQKQIKTKSKTK